MGNTRKLDQIIKTAAAKLTAVQARESWALAPKEQAKLAAFGTVAFAKATRLKASPMAERGMDAIWEKAENELRSEIAAAQTAKAEILHQAAAAKVAKKSSGWW
ncbi:hypothetical protein ABT391_36750 [Streptomyces jumonjinensis]|uniref:hypothetical protein n=1 Tax=Streptomyces jumonjinensis TaxID=1945 RepID=UPI00331FF3A7